MPLVDHRPRSVSGRQAASRRTIRKERRGPSTLSSASRRARLRHVGLRVKRSNLSMFAEQTGIDLHRALSLRGSAMPSSMLAFATICPLNLESDVDGRGKLGQRSLGYTLACEVNLHTTFGRPSKELRQNGHASRNPRWIFKKYRELLTTLPAGQDAAQFRRHPSSRAAFLYIFIDGDALFRRPCQGSILLPR